MRRVATVPMLPGIEHVGCLSVERIRDFEGVVSYSRHVHMTPRPGLKPRGYSRLTGSNGGTQSCRYHVENPARKSRITTLLGLTTILVLICSRKDPVVDRVKVP